MSDLRLTDDEVVALGSVAGAKWLPTLPTVDLSDEAGTAAAYVRGVRSLMVRGLVDVSDDGGPRAADAFIEVLLEFMATSDVHAVVSVAADAGEHPVLAGESYTAILRGSGADVLLSRIASNGIHEFDVVPPEAASDALIAYVRRAHDNGVAGGAERADESLCLLVLVDRPAGGSRVKVRQGRVEFWSSSDSGGEWVAGGDWDDVLASLGFDALSHRS